MNWENISDILMMVSSFSIMLPLLAAASRYAKNTRTLKSFTFLFVIGALCELVFNITDYYGLNNQPLVHIYTVIEFLFYSYIFSYCLPSWKKVIFLISGLFIVYAFINAVFMQSVWKFNTPVHTLESIILNIYSLLYYYKLLTGQHFDPLFGNAMFWIASGVLIYFSLNLFLFMLGNILQQQDAKVLHISWIIHSMNNIIANAMFARAFLCKPQQTTSVL